MSTAVHIYDSGFQSETVGTPNHKKIQILARCCFNYYQLSIAWHIKRQLRHVRLLVLSNEQSKKIKRI